MSVRRNWDLPSIFISTGTMSIWDTFGINRAAVASIHKSRTYAFSIPLGGAICAFTLKNSSRSLKIRIVGTAAK